MRKYIIYMICLFVTISSLAYAQVITKENNDIRSKIMNSDEIPNKIKEELGLL